MTEVDCKRDISGGFAICDSQDCPLVQNPSCTIPSLSSTYNSSLRDEKYMVFIYLFAL
jgi:hypothetical protein